MERSAKMTTATALTPTRFRRFRRSCTSLLFIGMLMFSTSTSYAAGGDLNVSYHSQNDIQNWVSSHTVEDLSNNMDSDFIFSFNQMPILNEGSYVEGSLSNENLNSALQLINNIRYIAGLPGEVTLSSKYTSAAQAGSLVSYANDSLSHYPTTPSGMLKKTAKLGVRACGESNIAWASWKNCSLEWTIMHSWMKDDSASNISTLGHRRWILNPEMKSTGFGAVSGDRGTYSAMYIFDFARKVKTDYQVAWPAQNMPTSYFPEGTPWSISLGKKLNAKNVSVVLTRLSDGKEWNFSNRSADGDFYVNNDGYGQYGCIIFNPEGLGECQDGDSFSVTISGAGKKISYNVNFFEAK